MKFAKEIELKRKRVSYFKNNTLYVYTGIKTFR